MIKRVTALTLMIFMFLIVGCKKQNSTSNEKTNIVVVLDVSDSMNKTDIGGGEVYFASSLLEAFNKNTNLPFKTSDDKILDNTYFGVVTYGLHAEDEFPLRALGAMSDKEYHEAFGKINGIAYDDTSGTNFYEAVSLAYQMCENNPADNNLIYVISDGQFDLNGDKPNPPDHTKKLNDYKKAYEKLKEDHPNYIVNTVTVNTNTDSYGSDNPDFTVDYLEYNGISKKVENYEEFKDIAEDFFEEIKSLLGLKIEWQKGDFPAYDGIVEFTLDKDYKTVLLTISPEQTTDGMGLRRDSLEPPKMMSIQTPDTKGALPFEQDMKTGGFLGLNKCKISVSEEPGMELKVIIMNAPKGEWRIELNEKSTFNVTKIEHNPFPWVTVLPIITICIVLILLLLMWLLYIPPIRYRKKAIPGFLTLEKSDGYANSTIVYEEYPIYAIAKKGKFINRGNLTLGTLLADKNYKNVIIKYCPDTDLDDAHLEVKGKDLSGNIHSFELYSDSAYIYNLNENTGFTVTWSC